jgi:hypothetical protein
LPRLLLADAVAGIAAASTTTAATMIHRMRWTSFMRLLVGVSRTFQT